MTANQKEFFKEVLLQLALALGTFFFLAKYFNIHRLDYSLPKCYILDCLMMLNTTGNLGSGEGWYYLNDRLGAPFGQRMYWFPHFDNFSFFIMWLVQKFGGNASMALHVQFLIGKHVTTILSFVVLRRLKFSLPLCFFGSLTFLITSYGFSSRVHWYAVLLAVPLVFYLCSLVIDSKEDPKKFMLWKWGLVLGACVLVAFQSLGTYYAFFGCYFLLLAAAYKLIHERKIRPLKLGGIFIFLICFFTVLQLVPTWLEMLETGRGYVTGRDPFYVPKGGLKLGDLILPISSHPFKSFGNFGQLYRQVENYRNDDLNLGTLGTMGFFIALFYWGIFQAAKGDRKEIEKLIGILIVGALLLSFGNGFSTLVAVYISPVIRDYARIAPFIDFFSIVAVLIFLEKLGKFIPIRNRIFHFALAVLLAFFVNIDRAGSRRSGVNQIAGMKEDGFFLDRNYFEELENKLPISSMIFQLPVSSYPEGGMVHKLDMREPLKGYIHTRHLKWSHGSMKETMEGRWLKKMGSLETKKLMNSLCRHKFSGILIDSSGYSDGGTQVLSEVQGIIKFPPFVAAKRPYAFFDIRNFCKKKGGAPL